MAILGKLLAHNMKEQRRILGISQATLAEWINTSTHYIAMIELERKTPSLPMVERIAAALKLNPAELFSMRNVPSASLKTLQKTVLADIEKAVCHVVVDWHLFCGIAYYETFCPRRTRQPKGLLLFCTRRADGRLKPTSP